MVRQSTFLDRLAATLLIAPLLLAATPPAPLERAVAAQRELVAEQPGSVGALNDLGNLLAETGELEEAEEVYRQAMGLGPERPEPPFNLALLLSATRRPKEARQTLKRLLEQHPDHAWAHYQLGTLLQARGSRGRALDHYREAFRLDPRLSDPLHNPHVLDNNLATAAMLEAFSQLAVKSTGRRIYTEPSRISSLLLPPLTAAPEMEKPAMDKPAMEEPAMEKPAMKEPAMKEPEAPAGEMAEEPAPEPPG